MTIVTTFTPYFIMIQLIRRTIAVAMAALFIGNAGAQEAKLKIATVDMAQLFKEFYKTAIAQQEINVERARIQKDNNESLRPSARSRATSVC